MTTTPLRHESVDDVGREPVVPFDPARGWAGADLLRRSCAVAALPLAALLCLVVLTGWEPWAVALWAWLLVGPTTSYALARVLRPEPRSWERTSRHVLAGAGTSFAVLAAAGLTSPSRPASGTAVTLFGSAAFALGITTIAWGLVAWAVRERRY